METLKLNSTMRNDLALSILEHRFGKDLKSLVQGYQDLAISVYDRVYSPEMKKKMEEIPQGWMPTSDFIKAEFGSSFVYLYFNGSTSYSGRNTEHVSFINKVLPKKPIVTMIVPECDKHQCIFKADASDVLAVEYERLVSVGRELFADVSLAHAEIKAALARHSTVSALVTAWPEIESFARSLQPAKPKLPTIQLEKLNKMLDLPPEVEAA